MGKTLRLTPAQKKIPLKNYKEGAELGWNQLPANAQPGREGISDDLAGKRRPSVFHIGRSLGSSRAIGGWRANIQLQKLTFGASEALKTPNF